MQIPALAGGSAPGDGRERSAASREALSHPDRARPAPDPGGASPGGCPPLESRGIIHRVHGQHQWQRARATGPDPVLTEDRERITSHLARLARQQERLVRRLREAEDEETADL